AVQTGLTAVALVAAPRAAVLTAAWAVGGCAGAALGAHQAQMLPDMRGLSFIARHRDLGWRFAGEYVVLQGASYVVIALLVPLFGVAAVGGLRGVFTLFGPYTTLIFGIA